MKSYLFFFKKFSQKHLIFLPDCSIRPLYFQEITPAKQVTPIFSMYNSESTLLLGPISWGHIITNFCIIYHREKIMSR